MPISPNKNLPIDAIKGVLILLVVIGHVWRALLNNGILHEESLYYVVDNWIYAFHMPAFFLISGLFAHKSAQTGIVSFLSKKAGTIVYPYFLWSLIQTSMQIFFSSEATHKISWESLVQIACKPIMQFWFLYNLFFIFIIFFITRKAFSSSFYILCFAFVIDIATQAWGTSTFLLLSPGFSKTFLFFALGQYISPQLLEATKETDGKYIKKWAGVTLLCLILSLWMTTSTGPLPLSDFTTRLKALPGTALVLFFVLFVFSLKRKGFSYLLSLIGGYSLEIYCAHVLFAAGFRIVLLKIGHTWNLPLHLIGGVIIGIVGPILLTAAANKLCFRYLFTWPSQTKLASPR